MSVSEQTIDTIKPRTMLVWDPLVRVFHWSLVVFFFIAYLTEDELEVVHIYAGYAVVLLVLFRIVWGVIGTPHARFSDFVTGPRRLLAYLKQMLAHRAPRYIGHNPAGAAMILALLGSLLATTISGMLLLGGDGAGPLAGVVISGFSGEWLEDVHEFFANATLVLVFLHVGGVILSSIAHRENLIKSMLTGRKREADTPD
ncbi:MAG: cytochrome b561 [marine bacterium B5-7]|nr:MAG: cytochrome b561 [marine bacterium B5-7]